VKREGTGVWEVTAKALGFPLPAGYRVLEDGDFVVVVNPGGCQIYIGSATGTTREALRTAIEDDLAARLESPDPTRGPADPPEAV
jgi:hypothetical protein